MKHKPHIARWPRPYQGKVYWGWGLWKRKRRHTDGWWPDVWAKRLEDL